MYNSFSQIKVDTLFIGTLKYPLKKSKIFRVYQSGPVDLPSEYEQFKNYNTAKTIKYAYLSDSIDAVELLDDGTKICVRKPRSCKDKYWDNQLNLYSFADTIKLTYNQFSTLKPYIKSNGSKINFYSSKISCLLNDTLTEIEHRNVKDGEIFAYWIPYSKLPDIEVNRIRQTTFILQDLYYLKNNATYYLDRQFIIILK